MMEDSRFKIQDSGKKKSSFRNLIAWQKSIAFVKAVYLVTAKFPKDETYGLTSQIKRAVISIPSNIAEGSSRKSPLEFIRFLNIAKGSLAEVETQLEIAKELSFISEQELESLTESTEEMGRLISA